MNVARLILREIALRKWNFSLALVSVGVAVACLIGTLTLLHIDDVRTNEILSVKQALVEAAGAELEDAMRKITKGLGFNVIILPEEQDLNEMHLEGSLSEAMPESYVDRLASSSIVTVNHLLPTVMKKLTWPETGISVVVYGTRGEVPIQHRDPKKPLLDAVPRGKMIVGYEIGRKLNLVEGAETVLLGATFTVLKTHDQRGTIDDSTVWINLKQAQELFGMENLVHAIQALECHCAGDRITAIRQEIAGILPGTQVIERGAPALARAEARNTAKETAEENLEKEKAARAALRRQREGFASVLIPVAMLGSAMWIGFLAFGNVRQRRDEIGVLRAIGFTSQRILGLFLGKALVVALFGAILGYGLGLFAGVGLGVGLDPGEMVRSLDAGQLGAAIGLATLLSLAGSWIPALLAIRQDPAVILQAD